MATAEQLLASKNLCEDVSVQFPKGTLSNPYQMETNGRLYKSAPVGTLILAITRESRGFEYFLASGLGNIFNPTKNT